VIALLSYSVAVQGVEAAHFESEVESSEFETKKSVGHAVLAVQPRSDSSVGAVDWYSSTAHKVRSLQTLSELRVRRAKMN